jgi:RNA polymerase nonessential primary-like sigma factor
MEHTASLTRYLAEINRHPLLGRADEVRLGRLAAAGDEGAKRRLVESNLRLVVAFARRYEGMGLDLLDLIQEGNLGLMAAVETYDWRRGTRFATHARWPIRRSITRALTTKSRVVRVPRHAAFVSTVSLHEPVGDDETTWDDILADENAVDPESLTAAADERRRVLRSIFTLGGRGREVVALRYGFDGSSERTLREVGDVLGLSVERVRQVEKRALKKLALAT